MQRVESCHLLVFLSVNAYVKTENVQRGVQKAHSGDPLSSMVHNKSQGRLHVFLCNLLFHGLLQRHGRSRPVASSKFNN